MTEQQLVVVGIVAAIVAVVAVLLLLGKSNSTHELSSSGPDPGGTFGDVTEITPGIFNPGTAPPPTYEVTDHVRPYDDKPKKEYEARRAPKLECRVSANGKSARQLPLLLGPGSPRAAHASAFAL